MSLFDAWELVDAAQEHDDALYIPDVAPGDIILRTRQAVVDDDRYVDGRPLCLIDTEILEAMATTPGAHPDATYLERERALETVLVQADGQVLRNYGTDDHVIVFDPAAVTLDHDLLEPARVVVLEVFGADA